MARVVIDKSIIFLVSIVVILLATVVIMTTSLKTDPIQDSVDNERMINVALILENKGKPVATEIFMYYPENARAAMLDVPSNTGLLINSINRYDAIDVVYQSDNPASYLKEIKTLIGADIDWYIIFDEKALVDIVDMLEGLSIFIPNKVRTVFNDKDVWLPYGFSVLDGDKSFVYACYPDDEYKESDIINRRQTLFQSLLKKMGEKNEFVMNETVFPMIEKRLKTNLKTESLENLFEQYARLETDRIVLQRLSGMNRMVEGKKLLFPSYDGELIKDIVKQSVNALLNADTAAIGDKVYKIEILNGTNIRGRAQDTSETYQSFGYEIVSVGNADSFDVEETIVIDRYGDSEAAKIVANVLRCKNIVESKEETTSPADFTIILGRDFNGRTCVY